MTTKYRNAAAVAEERILELTKQFENNDYGAGSSTKNTSKGVEPQTPNSSALDEKETNAQNRSSSAATDSDSSSDRDIKNGKADER